MPMYVYSDVFLPSLSQWDISRDVGRRCESVKELHVYFQILIVLFAMDYSTNSIRILVEVD